MGATEGLTGPEYGALLEGELRQRLAAHTLTMRHDAGLRAWVYTTRTPQGWWRTPVGDGVLASLDESAPVLARFHALRIVEALQVPEPRDA